MTEDNAVGLKTAEETINPTDNGVAVVNNYVEPEGSLDDVFAKMNAQYEDTAPAGTSDDNASDSVKQGDADPGEPAGEADGQAPAAEAEERASVEDILKSLPDDERSALLEKFEAFLEAQASTGAETEPPAPAPSEAEAAALQEQEAQRQAQIQAQQLPPVPFEAFDDDDIMDAERFNEKYQKNTAHLAQVGAQMGIQNAIPVLADMVELMIVATLAQTNTPAVGTDSAAMAQFAMQQRRKNPNMTINELMEATTQKFLTDQKGAAALQKLMGKKLDARNGSPSKAAANSPRNPLGQFAPKKEQNSMADFIERLKAQNG